MARRLRQARWLIALAALIALLTGCIPFQHDAKLLLRSDPPLNGMQASVRYVIDGAPNGASETNQADYQGLNDQTPLPLISTRFGKGAGTKTQTVQVTTADGTVRNMLGMNKRAITFGLTQFLTTEVATYEERDVKGNRLCGAKVRLNFQPNLAQQFFHDRNRRAWDSILYYAVPCQPNDPLAQLDLRQAKFIAMVIDQQVVIKVTDQPIFFNRGRSVTIVDGAPAQLAGGWWQSNQSILFVANMIRDMVKDLDTSPQPWLDFRPDGRFADAHLVYSAGDADAFLTFKRQFLNRQSSYIVHFRGDPTQAWHTVVIEPRYNVEWNDFKQNYHAVTGKDLPDLDSMVDQRTGLPKDVDNPDSDNYKNLKEIETAGCQNCPNPELEQILIRDGTTDTGTPLYATTIRGYWGANSSLVMFGDVPRVSVGDALRRGAANANQLGLSPTCPVRYNPDGSKQDKQYDSEDCANLMREGGLWDLLTTRSSQFGFDVVGQFQVRDNSSWASRCTGSGDTTSCSLTPTNRHLDASYLFNRTDQKLEKAWYMLQLLGEVGARTLGFSYASDLFGGNGLLFAMQQPLLYHRYFADLADSKHPVNPELVFALDARALQLPQTLAHVGQLLYGQTFQGES